MLELNKTSFSTHDVRNNAHTRTHIDNEGCAFTGRFRWPPRAYCPPWHLGVSCARREDRPEPGQIHAWVARGKKCFNIRSLVCIGVTKNRGRSVQLCCGNEKESRCDMKYNTSTQVSTALWITKKNTQTRCFKYNGMRYKKKERDMNKRTFCSSLTMARHENTHMRKKHAKVGSVRRRKAGPI